LITRNSRSETNQAEKSLFTPSTLAGKHNHQNSSRKIHSFPIRGLQGTSWSSPLTPRQPSLVLHPLAHLAPDYFNAKCLRMAPQFLPSETAGWLLEFLVKSQSIITNPRRPHDAFPQHFLLQCFTLSSSYY